MILESRQPLMSPAWSVDGQWLAYRLFRESSLGGVCAGSAHGRSGAKCLRALAFNGAPAWSPDGHKLALTLGGAGGNPDIYVLDLTTQDLTRVTDDPRH